MRRYQGCRRPRSCRRGSIASVRTMLPIGTPRIVWYGAWHGYALAAHGYQRATTDIDVVVPATSQAGQRVKEALMALPDRAAKDIEPRWFEEGENIRVADAFVVDLMLNANGQTYDTLSQYTETIELDGIPAKTITLEACFSLRKPCVTRTWRIGSSLSGRSKCSSCTPETTTEVRARNNLGAQTRGRCCAGSVSCKSVTSGRSRPFVKSTPRGQSNSRATSCAIARTNSSTRRAFTPWRAGPVWSR
jgi:hypothetical protein